MSSLFYRLFDSITSVVSSFSIISSTSLFSITRGGTNLSTLLPAVMTISLDLKPLLRPFLQEGYTPRPA